MSHQYNLHMDIEALKSKLLWQMTGEEFLFLQQNGVEQSERQQAITQIGRKIIVDADLAFELAGRKTGGRKVRSRDIL